MTPLINGINYDWGSISLNIFGTVVVGITKIDYKLKQKKDNSYGFGYEPVSRGYGMKEYEGAIELYTDELKRIISNSPNRDIFNIGFFDINVTFGGAGLLAQKDILRACEFTEHGLSAAQGDTRILTSLPLIIGYIER